MALWPYVLRYAVHLHNSVPFASDGKSRLEIFGGFEVGSRMKDYHTFGCPVFALQNALQGGKTIPRWSPRARLGVNLGPSPNHARNVYLVLNIATGLVSPQFHVSFNDFFETVRDDSRDLSTISTWQGLAGLERFSNTKKILEQREMPEPSTPSRTDSEAVQDLDFSTEVETDEPVQEPVTTDHIPQSDLVEDTGPRPASNCPPMQQNRRNPPIVIPPRHLGGTSSRGRQCTLSRRMQESITQGQMRNFAEAQFA